MILYIFTLAVGFNLGIAGVNLEDWYRSRV
jgi:hypothetical protein